MPRTIILIPLAKLNLAQHDVDSRSMTDINTTSDNLRMGADSLDRKAARFQKEADSLVRKAARIRTDAEGMVRMATHLRNEANNLQQVTSGTSDGDSDGDSDGGVPNDIVELF